GIVRDAAVAPSVVSGRLPRRTNEIALGARTLRSLDADVGSIVAVRANSGRLRHLRVVGRVVLPGVGTYPGSDKTALGEGAVVTRHALRTLGPDFGRDDYLIRFRRDASRATRSRLVNRIGTITGGEGATSTFEVGRQRRPSDILSYQRVRSTPIVLAAVLAVLALASIVHALVTSVR